MGSGKMSRDKGKRFEREVASIFRIAFPGTDPHRGWQARDGADAPDVIFPGLWIECKHRDRPNIPKAFEQARTESQGRGMPVAITRKTGERILCTLDMKDFLELLRDARRVPAESGASAPTWSEICDIEQSECSPHCQGTMPECSTHGCGEKPSE